MLSYDDERWNDLRGGGRMPFGPRQSARTAGNPNVPDWLEKDYFRSIQELSQIGITEISRANELEAVRAILSIIAIAKGLRNHGRFLLKYSEEELLDLESDDENG